jgi:2-keto-4-pentenoate hydratase/2-oxohepta-3-ene-1,7-dioic acid hydratase in catechol pathway
MDLMNLGNVFCIGRNYRLHAAELGNDVPDRPLLFLKPTHALTDMDNGTLILPGNRGQIHYEAELVVRIGRAYDPAADADELIDRLTVGIDFTLRDVQEQLKRRGWPWLEAKGFRHSAPIGRWVDYPGRPALPRLDFSLEINGKEVQRGNVREMIFDLNAIVHEIGRNYGLSEGDVIFTGTPAGVGAVADGDQLTVRLGEENLGTIRVALRELPPEQ